MRRDRASSSSPRRSTAWTMESLASLMMPPVRIGNGCGAGGARHGGEPSTGPPPAQPRSGREAQGDWTQNRKKSGRSGSSEDWIDPWPPEPRSRQRTPPPDERLPLLEEDADEQPATRIRMAKSRARERGHRGMTPQPSTRATGGRNGLGGGGALGAPQAHGKLDQQHRAARVGVLGPEPAPVLLDDAVRDREPEPAARIRPLGREE